MIKTYQSPKTTPSFIKWTGSKRPIAKEIVSHFPDSIETYYEPFIGGGSVFFELLRSNKNVKNLQISDANKTLIEIYHLVKDSPEVLIESYEKNWQTLQNNPKFFYSARDFYNESGCPLTFYFLTRTCYNGTIRYSKNGKFNTSHHFGRKGMEPRKVRESILYHRDLMANKNITIETKGYEQISPQNKNDVLYLDPPYTNNKTLYFGNIDFSQFQEWLGRIKCPWFLNVNGINSKDNEEPLSVRFDQKVLLNSGNSSFSRIKQKQVNVQEYFYVGNQNI